MEYVNHEGGISYYYPDFVIHLENGERFIVETKGAENLDDPRKIERLKTGVKTQQDLLGRYIVIYMLNKRLKDLKNSQSFGDLFHSKGLKNFI